MSNPILDEHPDAEEYVLFGLPHVGKSYIVDSSKPDMGREDWFWSVVADYAPDTRCGFDGVCRCKEWLSKGFDTEEEATIFAATLKAGARRVR